MIRTLNESALVINSLERENMMFLRETNKLFYNYSIIHSPTFFEHPPNSEATKTGNVKGLTSKQLNNA